MTPALNQSESGNGLERPLSVAILAMGGQGGGVLADWVVAVAEANGWHAQSTSVPGVAQRTGATLYYIEMMPPRGERAPVFSLMPAPGDVDIVVAAELMEAGRAILRGLATPAKTVLIASTHRAYAIAEKEKPGESIGDPAIVMTAAGIAAKLTIAFDMDEIAAKANTVISAPLFGALAGAGALPFARQSFEDVIRIAGKGVASSLTAFGSAFSRAASGAPTDKVTTPAKRFNGIPPHTGQAQLDSLIGRLRAYPESVRGMAFTGLRRVVDFQDPAYGWEYLDRLDTLLRLDGTAGGTDRAYAFTTTAAKYLAKAMAYDDVIGVADVKTRSSRFSRIAREMNATDGPIMRLTEFMHPGAEEVVGLLPAGLAHWVQRQPRLVSLADRLLNRGRRIETSSLSGFLQLYAISSLRRVRRRLLRHAEEMQHIKTWLDLAVHELPRNYDLAASVLAARRLIKGYADTHARGLSKYDRIMAAVPKLSPRPDGGVWMARLITSALQDERGDTLDGALRTIETL